MIEVSPKRPGVPGESWQETVFELRSELRIELREEGSRRRVVIEDPLRSKFFAVGEAEYEILAELDGQRTWQQIAEDRQANRPDRDPLADQERLEAVARWLVASNLVVSRQLNASGRLTQQRQQRDRSRRLAWFNPISIKVPLGNPRALLQRLEPWTRWLFTPGCFLAWLLLAAGAGWTLWQHSEQLSAASTGVLADGRWWWLLVIGVVLKFVHEIAHGLACRKYGGEVNEAGILFLLLIPMAYVNVTSSWRFPSRTQRMVVAAAGMYVELGLAFGGVLLWAYSDGLIADLAFQLFLAGSVTTLLFNANPLMRFDGYFLLADLLGVNNLYQQGTRVWAQRFQSWLWGIPPAGVSIQPGKATWVNLYGLLAWIWKGLISVGLLISASVLFQGAGIVISLLAAGLWWGLPLLRALQSSWLPGAARPVRWKRVGATAVIGVALAWLLFRVAQAPAIQSGPALVRFADQMSVRAPVDGFVREIAVEDGQPVRAGQLLIRLENLELSHQRAALAREMAEAEIQARIYRQERDFAAAEAEGNRVQQFEQQLRELDEQLEQLSVLAPRDGVVFRRDLEGLEGSYVHQGDVLLRTGKTSEKELLLSIDQRNLDSRRWAEGEVLTGVFPGQPPVPVRLARVEPAAHSVVGRDWLGLCASAGGPLPVRRVSDTGETDSGDWELVSPRFHVWLQLPADQAEQLQAGQRGRVLFRTRNQSLGQYLWISLNDWLTRKLESAWQQQG